MNGCHAVENAIDHSIAAQSAVIAVYKGVSAGINPRNPPEAWAAQATAVSHAETVSPIALGNERTSTFNPPEQKILKSKKPRGTQDKLASDAFDGRSVSPLALVNDRAQRSEEKALESKEPLGTLFAFSLYLSSP
jgi:hypothetical protein